MSLGGVDLELLGLLWESRSEYRTESLGVLVEKDKKAEKSASIQLQFHLGCSLLAQTGMGDED